MPDDVTIGELSRRISGMETRINDKFDAVNHRLDGLQFVSRDVYAVQMEQYNARISGLEESKKWILRTLVGAFALPMLVTILVAVLAIK